MPESKSGGTRHLRRIVGALAVVPLAACGSTVAATSQSGTSPVAGNGQGLAVPGTGATSVVPGTTNGAGPSAAPSGLTGPGTSSAPGAATGTAGGGGSGFTSGGARSGGAASAAAAPGVTATTIQVGVPYSVNGAAANKAIGGAGITQGDEKGETQAVIDDINSHGGILGRKIVPVWHAVDALSDDTSDSQYEAMCADFTQDHHVFAMMIGGDSIIERCAQEHGAVAVYDNLSVSSAQTFQQFPSYVEVSMMDLNRIVSNEADALAAQGYFSPWNAATGSAAQVGQSKVGIIAYDTPDFHYAVQRVLQPELARLGHPAASQDTVYVSEPKRTSDVGSLSAAEANAIVRFRQDGVEHVLIIDVTGLLTLEFLNQAESQHYFPRYGWNSQNGPEALAGPGDVPKDQMVGSMGIGWTPGLDLRPSDNPDNGPYSNDARLSCLKLMRSKGFTFSDANAEFVALLICNQFRFLETAIDAGGRSINQASFINGVNQVGSSFQSASTFSTLFGSTQHDGAAAYRYYQWKTSCGCMKYTSGNKTAVGEAAR